jgi:hypothetical protein
MSSRTAVKLIECAKSEYVTPSTKRQREKEESDPDLVSVRTGEISFATAAERRSRDIPFIEMLWIEFLLHQIRKFAQKMVNQYRYDIYDECVRILANAKGKSYEEIAIEFVDTNKAYYNSVLKMSPRLYLQQNAPGNLVTQAYLAERKRLRRI